MALLEVYDKNFNYLLQAENEYNKVVKRFPVKNKDYFDALRELRDTYAKEYNAIETKSNQLIYGNPEGKFDRKCRDRSALYMKVVQRSKKYKTWRNFFTAIGASAAFIILTQLVCYFLNIRIPFVSTGFETFRHIILLTAAWSGVFFEGSILFKSWNHIGMPPVNNKEEKKWLKKYFKSIDGLIGARVYLEVLIQREEAIEKYINLGDTYITAFEVKSEIISKMKKDVEKVMDDFMYDGEISTALDHVLESWTAYR